MQKNLLQGDGWFGLGLASIVAAFLTLRFDTLFFAICFAFALAIRSFRNNYFTVATSLIIIVASALSPIGITFHNFPGPPHLTHCCPGPNQHDEAIAAQSKGECVVCSDLVSGFKPRSYLVW